MAGSSALIVWLGLLMKTCNPVQRIALFCSSEYKPVNFMQSDRAKQSLLTQLVGNEDSLKYARAWQTDCARITLYQAMGWMSPTNPPSSEISLPDNLASEAQMPGEFFASADADLTTHINEVEIEK